MSNIKGTFSKLPKELQPIPINIHDYSPLASKVISNFFITTRRDISDTICKNYSYFITDIKKSILLNKQETGDMDIVIGTDTNFIPLKEYFIREPHVIAHESNGDQLMVVTKNLLGDNKNYMIDFMFADRKTYNFRTFYHGFGTMLPAILGSFARTLRYKFAMDGFYLRYKDNKNNYHNLLLTLDYDKMLDILMLDKTVVKTDQLYTPGGLATWIADSPRFDVDLWNRPTCSDGTTIVTINRHSHRAIRQKPETQLVYSIISNINKKSAITNDNYEIERRVLGDDVVNNLINQIEIQIQLEKRILTGNEIMKILDIKPGPLVGEMIKLLNTDPIFVNLTQEELDTPKIKQIAKEYVLLKYKDKI